MKRLITSFLSLAVILLIYACSDPVSKELDAFPQVSEKSSAGWFPLSGSAICYDPSDFKVVGITAGMLSDDIGRVTGSGAEVQAQTAIPEGPAVVAGTVGHSALVDALVREGKIDVSALEGKWESYIVQQVRRKEGGPLLVVAGSDRRGTAFGLTALGRATGVSPWYFWADVTPAAKAALYVQPGRFLQKEPSVQYRGIFINDERFGGWAKWVEQTFDKETGKVGPKVYEKVFELLLRLGGNYLWPAMHPGTAAFNDNPENARLADDYAIVMGSSHCEQMLRNNEGEWKAVGTYGDFNYITNRKVMQDYWEERVRTNGKYENTYTLGLRGIHDYPMEGANTTTERRNLMQQAIDDQRDMLRRNIDKPLEEIPQVLCTYEEVLDAYHDGLVIPEEVTMLWADDKQGYTRNLCNPEEMKRKGGAGIYYHISYHGDPASWIWLSPLSPAFISTELTKAYTFGARKIWVFNVGDIKPAEKELTFAMQLAWDIDRWSPEKAHGFIREWAGYTFGEEFAQEISDIQDAYYRFQASGKDAHVYFLEYPEEQIRARIDEFRAVAARAEALEGRIPERLRAAYFELVLYPVKGAEMINEYQLLSRLSLAHATYGDSETALKDAARAVEMYDALNDWTRRYNQELLGGKWDHFFDWRPYFWNGSKVMDAPVATKELLDEVAAAPRPGFLSVDDALSGEGVRIDSEVEGDIQLWIKALSPIRNFSKAPEDNVFCRVVSGGTSFNASATPINNIWHAPYVGPMWSKVGTIHLRKGSNVLSLTELKPDARIDDIFLGVYPPFPAESRLCVPAADYSSVRQGREGRIATVPQLGFSDGVLVLPFDTPSYDAGKLDDAPCVEFDLDLKDTDTRVEVRTLPTLHVYEGRDARYAVRLDDRAPEVFSIHTDDFSAEWRWNVLRGYSFRTVDVRDVPAGKHSLKVYLLDPGIVLQEVRVFDR